MSFGLKFTNNSNVVTLDSEFARLSVICSGRYAPTGDSGLSSTTAFPVVITSIEPPLVFVRPDTVSGGFASVASVAILGSPGNWVGFSLRAYNVNSAFPNGRYFAAAFAAQATANYGLRLWDGASNLLFDNGTPSALFTRAFQTWTYDHYTTGSQGDIVCYFTVGFNFPDNEFMLINNIAMNMVAGSASGRVIGTLWDFAAGKLWLTAGAVSNPTFIYLPTLFAKQAV